jgi:hypothetical protein
MGGPSAQPSPTSAFASPVWTPPPIGVLGEAEVTPTPLLLLPVRQARNHIGDYLEITLDNGKVLRVILLAVSDRGLKVAENVGGGEIRYEVPKSKIRGFQLAR